MSENYKINFEGVNEGKPLISETRD